MKRDKPPYLRDYELKRWGEPSLRYFAKQCAEEAKTHERAAAIARDKARWFLAAADAKAAEKRARRDGRRARRQAERKASGLFLEPQGDEHAGNAHDYGNGNTRAGPK
jgi:membrane protein involved in colicin uptake